MPPGQSRLAICPAELSPWFLKPQSLPCWPTRAAGQGGDVETQPHLEGTQKSRLGTHKKPLGTHKKHLDTLRRGVGLPPDKTKGPQEWTIDQLATKGSLCGKNMGFQGVSVCSALVPTVSMTPSAPTKIQGSQIILASTQDARSPGEVAAIGRLNVRLEQKSMRLLSNSPTFHLPHKEANHHGEEHLEEVVAGSVALEAVDRRQPAVLQIPNKQCKLMSATMTERRRLSSLRSSNYRKQMRMRDVTCWTVERSLA